MEKYESEAMFEKLVINQLNQLGFEYIKLNKYEKMVLNFKKCLEKFNSNVLKILT